MNSALQQHNDRMLASGDRRLNRRKCMLYANPDGTPLRSNKEQKPAGMSGRQWRKYQKAKRRIADDSPVTAADASQMIIRYHAREGHAGALADCTHKLCATVFARIVEAA